MEQNTYREIIKNMLKSANLKQLKAIYQFIKNLLN